MKQGSDQLDLIQRHLSRVETDIELNSRSQRVFMKVKRQRIIGSFKKTGLLEPYPFQVGCDLINMKMSKIEKHVKQRCFPLQMLQFQQGKRSVGQQSLFLFENLPDKVGPAIPV